MAEKSNQGVQLARVHLEESRKSLTDRGELGKRSSGRWIYIVVGLAVLVGGVLAVVLGIRLPSRNNSHTDQGSWSVELKVSAPSFDKEAVSAFNTKLALVVGLPEALIDTVATAAGSDFRLIASASGLIGTQITQAHRRYAAATDFLLNTTAASQRFGVQVQQIELTHCDG
jgi:hypothetical protein